MRILEQKQKHGPIMDLTSLLGMNRPNASIIIQIDGRQCGPCSCADIANVDCLIVTVTFMSCPFKIPGVLVASLLNIRIDSVSKSHSKHISTYSRM